VLVGLSPTRLHRFWGNFRAGGAVTFLLGFVVERTDSLLLAVTLHEWIDIAVDSGGTYLMWAALACIPLWLWLIWTWPDRASFHMPSSTSEAREIKQIVVTRE
jgi:hypothetical protein